MQIEIKLRPNLFSNPNAPALAKSKFREAVGDPSAQIAVRRASSALTRLVSEFARDAFLTEASLAALDSGLTVAEELCAIETRLMAGINGFSAARRELKARLDARRAVTQPLLTACVSELLALGGKAHTLSEKINGFARAQAETHERLVEAGLSDTEIGAIGLKPTNADREEWERDLKMTRGREQQITAFLKSGPEYDESILGDEQNATAGD